MLPSVEKLKMDRYFTERPIFNSRKSNQEFRSNPLAPKEDKSTERDDTKSNDQISFASASIAPSVSHEQLGALTGRRLLKAIDNKFAPLSVY